MSVVKVATRRCVDNSRQALCFLHFLPLFLQYMKAESAEVWWKSFPSLNLFPTMQVNLQGLR
jgi:hypothetical protein